MGLRRASSEAPHEEAECLISDCQGCDVAVKTGEWWPAPTRLTY